METKRNDGSNQLSQLIRTRPRGLVAGVIPPRHHRLLPREPRYRPSGVVHRLDQKASPSGVGLMKIKLEPGTVEEKRLGLDQSRAVEATEPI